MLMNASRGWNLSRVLSSSNRIVEEVLDSVRDDDLDLFYFWRIASLTGLVCNDYIFSLIML